MGKFILVLWLILFNLTSYSQTCTTLVVSDRIETYDWFGNWWVFQSNSGFSSLASTSPTASARIFGLGLGSSSIEQNWYVLPNITGLNPLSTYEFKFRLASYKFSSTATSGGVDGGTSPDFVEVQVSTDGEITYVSEIRIRGNNNAFWGYNTNGVINKTANGTLTTYFPAAGNDRTTTGDGYSVITLRLPTGITQVAVDILTRVNAAGEEWWIDDIELFEIFDCSPLPIELMYFDGKWVNNYNLLSWSTASELNNDYFTIERSLDGYNWETFRTIPGSGNSNYVINYEFKDYDYSEDKINYYRLSQTDFNGVKEIFNIIAINNLNTNTEKRIVKRITIDGKEIKEDYKGLYIEIYEDGSAKKLFKQ